MIAVRQLELPFDMVRSDTEAALEEARSKIRSDIDAAVTGSAVESVTISTPGGPSVRLA